MAKENFEESRKAAEALAKKLNVPLIDLQEMYRKMWKQLGPSLGQIARNGLDAEPLVVEYDESGNVISVKEA